MRFLENFILDIPYLFLKKIPYAWLAVIFFWIWPPVLLSWILVGIVLLGLIMMVWQRRAWETKLIREHHQKSNAVYIDRPKMPVSIQLRNMIILALGSVALAWPFQGRFELNFWQWVFLLIGFMLLYMDHRLLGSTTVYIVTDQGIGIRFAPGHIDYRLFFSYGEIRHVQPVQVPDPRPLRWSVTTPTRNPKGGVLLTPRNPNGFSRQIEGEVLLTPTDTDEFMKHIPHHLARQGGM